jgi:Flp pilus assembly pilin Flp
VNARLLKLLVRLTGAQDERGATAFEYAVMVALIAVVIVCVVRGVGSTLISIFQTAAVSL